MAVDRPDVRRRTGRPDRGVASLWAGVRLAHDRQRSLHRPRRQRRARRSRADVAQSCGAFGAHPTTRRLMPQVLQAFLVAFGVVFLAELPDKTMFATIVLATRYRRPVAVVAGVAPAMAFPSLLAAGGGGAIRPLPRPPTPLAGAAVFTVGGGVPFRGGGGAA